MNPAVGTAKRLLLYCCCTAVIMSTRLTCWECLLTERIHQLQLGFYCQWIEQGHTVEEQLYLAHLTLSSLLDVLPVKVGGPSQV